MKTVKNTILKAIKTLLLPLAIFALFSLVSDSGFSSPQTLYVMLQQSVGTAIVAYGFAFANMVGITDFSIGSRLILAEIIGGMCAARFGIPGLVLGCILTSIICGILSAVVFRVTKIPSFIVAFGLVLIFEVCGSLAAQAHGGTVILTRATAVLGRPPFNFIILIIAGLLFSVILYRTRFSYQVQAVGNNEVIARSMGVNSVRVKCMTYVVGSVFIGIAAIVLLSYSSAIGAQMGMMTMSQLFRPMMAFMIAKILKKNCPIPIGIVVGVYSLNLLFTGIVAIGLLDAFQDVALGFMMILVIVLTNNLYAVRAFFRRLTTRGSLANGQA